MHQGQNKQNKIVLTGGHAATTALVTIQKLKKKGHKDIHFIGARFAVEGKRVPTLEAEVLPKHGVAFHSLIAGRIQRNFTLWTVPSLLKIPVGFLHSFLLLLKIRPAIILSFGGFASFPVVFMGWVLSIPVILHEQTAVAGRANIYSSFFAKKVAVARKSCLKYFPPKKTQVVGNPIMAEISAVAPKEKIGQPPTVYITGGSRGARSINDLIAEILPKLLPEFRLIHHTGELDFEKFRKLRATLPKQMREAYEIYASIDPTKIAGIYKKADLIVSRAGANTVAEIMAVKRPAILIPLPFAYLNEQRKNAEYAERFGIAKVLEQDQEADKLLAEVNKIRKNWGKIVSSVKDKQSPDSPAAGRLVGLVEEVLRGKT